MFPTRIGSEKPGSEVLQDAFLKKEGPDGNKEFTMWIDTRFALGVEM